MEKALVFDIGNGSVGCALVSLQTGGLPSILFTSREVVVTPTEANDPKTLEDLTIAALQKTCESAQKHGVSGIKDIFFVVSSPWYVSKTVSLRVEKPKPFLFEKNTLEPLLQDQKKVFLSAYDQQNAGTPQATVDLIERAVMQVKLNGYKTKLSYDKRARVVNASFYMSLMSRPFRARIEDVFFRFFHLKKIHPYSFSRVAQTVVRDMFPHVADFFFIDVSAAMTDVTLVKDGVLTETFSFPIGRTNILSFFAAKLSTTVEAASSLLQLYGEGNAEKAAAENIENVLQEVKAEWDKNFEESLSHLGLQTYIPQTAYLTAEKDVAHVFLESIKAIPLEGVLLTPESFQAYCTEAKGVPSDVFLSIETLFLNKAFAFKQF